MLSRSALQCYSQARKEPADIVRLAIITPQPESSLKLRTCELSPSIKTISKSSSQVIKVFTYSLVFHLTVDVTYTGTRGRC